jgi:ankyrin repeat protein
MPERRTLLHDAVRHGEVPMAQWLLNSAVDVNARSNRDEPALHAAVGVCR